MIRMFCGWSGKGAAIGHRGADRAFEPTAACPFLNLATEFPDG